MIPQSYILLTCTETIFTNSYPFLSTFVNFLQLFINFLPTSANFHQFLTPSTKFYRLLYSFCQLLLLFTNFHQLFFSANSSLPSTKFCQLYIIFLKSKLVLFRFLFSDNLLLILISLICMLYINTIIKHYFFNKLIASDLLMP